jgi:protein SCO1/2
MRLLLLLLLPLFVMAYRLSNYGEQDVSVVKIQEEFFLGKEIPDAKVLTLNGTKRLKEFMEMENPPPLYLPITPVKPPVL